MYDRFLCAAPGCNNPVHTNKLTDAMWVALGQVVCSEQCHSKMYDPEQYMLPVEAETNLVVGHHTALP